MTNGIELINERLVLTIPDNLITMELEISGDGSVGVLYERQLSPQSGELGVFFRKLDANLAPDGDEIALSLLPDQFRVTSNGTFPTIGGGDPIALQALVGGGFMAVWTLYPSDVINPDNAPNFAGLGGSLLQPDGTPIADGFLVSPLLVLLNEQIYLNRGYHQPEASLLADGDVVVSWGADLRGPDGSFKDGTPEIFTARFDPETGERRGDPVQANEFVDFDQGLVDVAGLTGGGHVAVWWSRAQDIDFRVDLDFGGIYARAYDADGQPLGGEIPVATNSGTQIFPIVMALPDGGFLIFWQDDSSPVANNQIMQRRYDAAGQPLAPAEVVGNIRFATTEIKAAVLADGGWIVAWSPNIFTDDFQLRRYDAAGDPVGDDVILRIGADQSVNRISYVLETVIALDDGGFRLFAGSNVTFGAPGNLHAFDFEALYFGSRNNDVLIGRDGGFDYDAKAGNDTVMGGDGNDTIEGGDGADRVEGAAGNDSLHGGTGNDFVAGGAGNDRVFGDAGNDTIYLGLGDDLGGGGAGNDLIFGGAGFNIIYGGFGSDEVQGGVGNDTVYGGGNGSNRLFGNDGDDLIFTGSGGDFVGGGAGTDVIRGELGADTIYGGLGNDNIGGGAGNDSLFGSDGADTIFAGLGDDFIGGGAGDDLIIAGAGANRIFGGVGNDTLVAGSGRDILNGGPGADVFVFASAASVGIGTARDVITDFTTGVDTIDLRGLDTTFNGATGLSGAGVPSFFYFVPGGLLIGDQNGDRVADWVLELSSAPALLAQDFLL